MVADVPVVKKEVDEVISIRHLKGSTSVHDTEDDFADPADISRAVGTGSGAKAQDDLMVKLKRLHQLTGFADPVYAEAFVTVLEFDIVLDILIVNQTKSMLQVCVVPACLRASPACEAHARARRAFVQNVTLELATSRDLKLIDRPQSYNMAPFDFVRLQVNVKVSSTEAGIIFGNIVLDSASGANKTVRTALRPARAADPFGQVVVLNPIHMDIVDYIQPATCTAQQFRHMWAEFEWENKIAVNTDIPCVLRAALKPGRESLTLPAVQ